MVDSLWRSYSDETVKGIEIRVMSSPKAHKNGADIKVCARGILLHTFVCVNTATWRSKCSVGTVTWTIRSEAWRNRISSSNCFFFFFSGLCVLCAVYWTVYTVHSATRHYDGRRLEMAPKVPPGLARILTGLARVLLLLLLLVDTGLAGQYITFLEINKISQT